MTAPFEHYSRTPRGHRLALIINDPARYPEYRAFSREGFPAVTALVSLVNPSWTFGSRNRREFDAAKQLSAGPLAPCCIVTATRSSARSGSPVASSPSGRFGMANQWPNLHPNRPPKSNQPGGARSGRSAVAR